MCVCWFLQHIVTTNDSPSHRVPVPFVTPKCKPHPTIFTHMLCTLYISISVIRLYRLNFFTTTFLSTLSASTKTRNRLCHFSTTTTTTTTTFSAPLCTHSHVVVCAVHPPNRHTPVIHTRHTHNHCRHHQSVCVCVFPPPNLSAHTLTALQMKLPPRRRFGVCVCVCACQLTR